MFMCMSTGKPAKVLFILYKTGSLAPELSGVLLPLRPRPGTWGVQICPVLSVFTLALGI